MERRQDRACRRNLRARRLEPNREFDVWGEGPIPPEPSDGDAIPAEPPGLSLALPEHFRPALGSQDPRLTAQDTLNPMRDPNCKRPGEHLVAPSNVGRRASKDPEETD